MRVRPIFRTFAPEPKGTGAMSKEIKLEIEVPVGEDEGTLRMNGTEIGTVYIRDGKVSGVNAHRLPRALREMLTATPDRELWVRLSPDKWCEKAEGILEDFFSEMADFRGHVVNADYAALYMENTGKTDSYGP